jgi:hypothetical protein
MTANHEGHPMALVLIGTSLVCIVSISLEHKHKNILAYMAIYSVFAP